MKNTEATFPHPIGADKGSILVVDDTPANLHTLLNLLTDHGYEGRVAPNGPMALQSVQVEPPTLILLDIHMPGMNGYEVCQQLKQDPQTRDIPVIFISALSEAADIVKGFEVGGVDYITKPFQIEVVLARVQTHLSIRNLQIKLELKNRELAQEIVERRQAETYFKQVLSSAPDAIVLVNEIGEITLTNNQVQTLLGYTPEEIIGQPVERLILARYAATHSYHRHHYLDNPTTRSMGQDLDLVVRHKDGHEIPVEVNLSPLQYGGSIQVFAAIRDVTHKKQAEQTLRASEAKYSDLYNNAPDMYVSVEVTTRRIIECNHTFAQKLGYTKTEVMAQSFLDFYHPDSQEKAITTLQELLQSGHIEDVELQMQRKDGSQLDISLNASAVYDEQGHIAYSRSTCRDITERKKAEFALQQLNQDLDRRVKERTAELETAKVAAEAANEAKSNFMAIMSHELRTPLNAILGMSEVLREQIHGALNAEQLNSLQYIEEGGYHLLHLINDILDISKIEADHLDLDITLISVTDLCNASMRFIQPLAQDKGIGLKTIFDHSITSTLADERRLKQILINLLSNAVKFTPPGGQVIMETKGNADNRVIHFTVSDTGVGISKANLEHIFKPFTQLDSALTRQFEGTGLGLALVARLVELHGGGVTVESKVGQGSRFNVSLPWSNIDEMEPDMLHQPATQNVSIFGHALVIEDSNLVAFQLTRYLKRLKIETTVHTQGTDALEKVRDIQPGIIFLELTLPGQSGWEVLAKLKNHPQTASIPVVIVSDAEHRTEALGMGAGGYLVKPINIEDLEKVLQRLLSTLEKDSQAPKSFPPTRPPAINNPPLILLAEDNQANIVTIQNILKSKAYRVIVAKNGAEALNQAKAKSPDLILMDIQMPVMNGLEAIRLIRADTDLAHTPIIALTALAMPGDREKCLEAGADDYLSKPINIKGLVRAVEEQLQQQDQATQ